MLSLYEKIESLCKSSNTNITKMCKDAGVSRGSISDLKMGRIETLSAKTLSKIADYFGCTVDALIGNDYSSKSTKIEEPKEQEELNEYLKYLRTRPEMKMLFNLTKDATTEDVKKAVKIIETILGKGE